MNSSKFMVMALIVAGAASCKPDDNSQPIQTATFDFNTSVDGWTGDFTDYSTPQDSIMEFSFAQSKLPAPLDTTRKGLRISGHNRSDDMFMFIKKKVSNLAANTEYNVDFSVDLASMYADGSVGIGGSPGNSVYLKAGATATEPKKIKEGEDYKLNIDKGNQAEGGKDAVVLGDVNAGANVTEYKTINRTNASKPLKVKTDSKGELWILVGTDSGFEGLTTLYYQKVQVKFTPTTIN